MRTFLDRLARLQHAHALFFAIVGIACAAAALPLVMRLGLKTGFEQLLPSDARSIRDLEAARRRIHGLSTLTVVVQSRDREALRRFAAELGTRLSQLQGHRVRSVDFSVREYEAFVQEHAHLYASLEDLRELRDALADRVAHEKLAKNPLYVDLSDEPPPDPLRIIGRMRTQAEQKRAQGNRFEGGFFLHPTRDLLAIFVRTDAQSGDVHATQRLLQAVQREVAALSPTRYARDLRVEYAGDLLSVLEEHEALIAEMLIATALTLGLVFSSIYVFFRRIRALPLLGLALLPPVLVTFAIGKLVVGHLNTSTIFLASIVIGNGINPNIIWLARYFEARRSDQDVLTAVRTTHAETWSATLTASVAAAVAYASLVLTDFRGFQDFGVIGGVGMLLCWCSALMFLPALAVLSERASSLRTRQPDAQATARAQGVNYGALFWSLVRRWPEPILRTSAVVALVCVGLCSYAIYRDPIEYDFGKLRSAGAAASRTSVLNGWVNEIVGATGAGNSLVMLLPTREVAAFAERELERAGASTTDPGPYGQVRSLDDLLPREQDQKLHVLAEIRSLLLQVRDFVDAERARRIDEHLPPADIRVLTPADLPRKGALPFTEHDGTRGRILFVEHAPGASTWDGRYLIRWTAAARSVSLPGDAQALIVGNAPVFADIVQVVWRDGPKAVGVSLLATIVLVALTFRSLRTRLLTLSSLLLGVLWMAGGMTLLRMKLNFLNFVCFPITFGNGVDYAVNVMQRHAIESARLPEALAVRATVRGGGSAVLLNSLTTVIGYASLLVSSNQALRSFGWAMAISEVTCVTAAVLVLPAYLLRRAERASGQPSR